MFLDGSGLRILGGVMLNTSLIYFVSRNNEFIKDITPFIESSAQFKNGILDNGIKKDAVEQGVIYKSSKALSEVFISKMFIKPDVHLGLVEDFVEDDSNVTPSNSVSNNVDDDITSNTTSNTTNNTINEIEIEVDGSVIKVDKKLIEDRKDTKVIVINGNAYHFEEKAGIYSARKLDNDEYDDIRSYLITNLPQVKGDENIKTEFFNEKIVNITIENNDVLITNIKGKLRINENYTVEGIPVNNNNSSSTSNDNSISVDNLKSTLNVVFEELKTPNAKQMIEDVRKSDTLLNLIIEAIEKYPNEKYPGSIQCTVAEKELISSRYIIRALKNLKWISTDTDNTICKK